MKDIKGFFRQDFDEWAEASNLAYSIDIDGRRVKRPRAEIEAAKRRALLEIWEVLKNHPDADYFCYSGYNFYCTPGIESRLTWSAPEDQVVPSDSLRVVYGLAKILAREKKLEELGIYFSGE